jgi:ArsR family transcriptional regulator
MIDNGTHLHPILDWMDALSESTRLRILRLLEKQELSVVEICSVVQLPQSRVSRHLKLLAGQGWVRLRRHGTANFYRMVLDEVDPPARQLWLLTREQTAHWPTFEQDSLRLATVLEARKSRSDEFFEGAAGEWDQIRRKLYGHAYEQLALLALLPADWVVADLGCGTGHVVIELARCVQHVIGVDRSLPMLQTARDRVAGMDNVTLHQGDLESVPVADDACDAAVLMLVLTYVTEPTAALREARRILRPGGRLVVLDLLRHDDEEFRRRMGQHHLGFEESALASQLAAAGLADVASRPLSPAEQAEGPALMLAVGNKPKTTHQGPMA